MSNRVLCNKCNVELLPVTKRKSITFSGVVSVLIFLIGLLFILTDDLIAGALVILFGLVIGFSGKRQTTIMKCPSCGNEGRTL